MSLRNRKNSKVFTNEDANQLRKINMNRDSKSMKGLSPDQISRMSAAEETVFAVKDSRGTKRGDQVSDNFKKISDIDSSQGIVIHNPVTGKNEAVLGRDNLHNMDGSLHPATIRYMKKHH